MFVSGSTSDAQVFRRIVASSGRLVVNVPDLQGAVAVIEKVSPAIVVCDTEIEGKGSWRDLLGKHRTSLIFAFIVVSPRPDDPLRAEVLNLGGDAVLARPFLAEEVERTVASALCRFKPGV